MGKAMNREKPHLVLHCFGPHHWAVEFAAQWSPSYLGPSAMTSAQALRDIAKSPSLVGGAVWSLRQRRVWGLPWKPTRV